MKQTVKKAVLTITAVAALATPAAAGDDFMMTVVKNMSAGCPVWNSADFRNLSAADPGDGGSYGKFVRAFNKMSTQMSPTDGKKLILLLGSRAFEKSPEAYDKAVLTSTTIISSGLVGVPITADQVISYDEGISSGPLAGKKPAAYRQFFDALAAGDPAAALAAVRGQSDSIAKYVDMRCKGWGGAK